MGSGLWGNVELLTLTLSFPSNRKRYETPTLPLNAGFVGERGGWAICSFSAARVKFSSSATAMK